MVRKEKVERATRIEQGLDDDADDREGDLYSDTSSMAPSARSSAARSQRSHVSLTTAHSQHSGKSRRRLESKQRSLREGGMFEEEALLDALAQLATQLDLRKEAVGQLICLLLLLERPAQAREIQTLLATALAAVQSRYNEIWSFRATPATTEPLLAGPGASTNAILAAAAAAAKGMSTGGITDLQSTAPPPGDLVRPLPPTLRHHIKWQSSLLELS